MWDLEGSITRNVLCASSYLPTPASSRNQVPDSIFIDRFLDFLQLISTKYSNITVMGDFNLHVNDPSNPDATIFTDAISALGFIQHVYKATHSSGNTLDLVLTEESSNSIRVLDTKYWILYQTTD